MEAILANGKLDLKQFQHWVDSKTVLTGSSKKSENIPSVSKQKKVHLARKHRGKLQYLKHSTKRAGKSRNVSYPTAEKFVLDTVTSRWERGDPAMYQQLYFLTSKKFNDDACMSTFKHNHLDPLVEESIKKTWMGAQEKNRLPKNSRQLGEHCTSRCRQDY
jgi:hypothetical protein